MVKKIDLLTLCCAKTPSIFINTLMTKKKTPVRSLVCFLKLSRYKYNVIDKLTSISKSLFNATIFYGNVYFKLKYRIFEDFLSSYEVYGLDPYDDNDSEFIRGHFKTFIECNFQDYIDIYLKIIKNRKHNNNPIYNEVSRLSRLGQINLCDFEIFKNIFDLVYKNLIEINVLTNDLIVDDDTNDDSIYRVLCKIMLKFSRIQFNQKIALCKFEIQKFTEINFFLDDEISKLIIEFDDLVENNKIDEAILIQKKIDKVGMMINENLQKLSENHIIHDILIQNIENIENFSKEIIIKGFDDRIDLKGIDKNADQSIVSNLITKNIKIDLAYDIKHEIIGKAYSCFTSYYAKMMTHPFKNNKPQFKGEDERYIVPITKKMLSTKIINGQHYIVVPCGTYIQSNYIEISGDLKLIQLNTTDKKYKYYTMKENVIINPPTLLTQKFKREHLEFNNKYIKKDDKRIINGFHFYIPLKKEIYNKTNYFEIYKHNRDFKLTCVYDVKLDKEVNTRRFASCDLGGRNLMAVYSPNAPSILISGGPLRSTNRYYGMMIDDIKAEKAKREPNFRPSYVGYPKNPNKKYKKNPFIKKCKNLDKMQDIIQNKRNNKVNDYMIRSADHLINYCIENKIETVVIGLNKGWKNKGKMGKQNNRDFQSIPHSKLIKLIECKAKQRGIKMTTREESYTSCCDALARESIEKHEQYLGKRDKKQRGLFTSSTGLKINADINGAINILRKHLIENEGRDIKRKKLKKSIRYIKNPLEVNVYKTNRIIPNEWFFIGGSNGN